MRVPARDPNYQVDGLPPAIKGKVTEMISAAFDYAFIGTYENADAREAIEEGFHVARHDLERTIKTYLDREAERRG